MGMAVEGIVRGDGSEDRLLVVSVDSHAQAPPHVWPQYLERRYHEFLPALNEDNEVYTTVMAAMSYPITGSPEMRSVYDLEGAQGNGGFAGIWDADVRLREMDREGIAAEFVYFGDHRASAIFYNVFNRKYDNDVCEAGVRAYHRWLHDTFGHAHDRLFLVGAGGPGLDIEATVAELSWVADRGFRGTYAPGFLSYPGLRPLFDDYWEPVWRLCAERSLPLFVHAGFGQEQGRAFPEIARIKKEVDAAGGTADDLVARVRREVLKGDFFADVSPRRPMWQLMFGGIFDRHPGLKLVMTEVRADWLPETLRYLDQIYLKHRSELPARRMPSEYWQTNCLVSVSSPHPAETALRYEIGLETVAFGRDYPHNESTWPNTIEWVRDAFSSVPENELRLMLGGNVVRCLGLESEALVRIADRIGPTLGQLTAGPEVDPRLIAHFDLRGGYLKPPEGDTRLPAITGLIEDDLGRLTTTK
jgi:predicted TIM-barrel fold metal-dependent hydrolase